MTLDIFAHVPKYNVTRDFYNMPIAIDILLYVTL